MAHIDEVYNKLAKAVLKDGFSYLDKSRGNIEMLQIPHYTLDIDMLQGFPLLTTKRIFWKACVHELIWMLSGEDNIDYLLANKVNIWTKDAYDFSKSSYVGRIYGVQWRHWTTGNKVTLDQIKGLIESLKNGDLYNRRHIVNAWNPAELHDMALPPCHWSFEIIPTGLDSFAIKWHQRSCDTMLGIPFDIALYATLGRLIEHETGLQFTRLIGDLSNVHFYGPHIPLIKEQLKREPMPDEADLCISSSADFNNLNIEDFKLIGYLSHSAIKAELFTKSYENIQK